MDVKIVELYKKYNNTLRPLVSEIEGRNECFEEPLLPNTASMFDSIALSESSNDEDTRSYYIEQALCYLDLSISQSYQYLIKNLHEKIVAFEKRCDASGRGILDNGKFIGKYVTLKCQAENCTREGRAKGDIKALSDFASAYYAYSKIEKLIDRELPVQIMQNTRKNSRKWTIAGWILSIFISVAIGKVVNTFSDSITEWVKVWMNV